MILSPPHSGPAGANLGKYDISESFIALDIRKDDKISEILKKKLGLSFFFEIL